MKLRTVAFTMFALSACVEEEQKTPPDYLLMCKQFSTALCNYVGRCDQTVTFGECMFQTEGELECPKVKGTSDNFAACLDATTRKQCSPVVQVDPACVGVFEY